MVEEREIAGPQKMGGCNSRRLQRSGSGSSVTLVMIQLWQWNKREPYIKSLGYSDVLVQRLLLIKGGFDCGVGKLAVSRYARNSEIGYI